MGEWVSEWVCVCEVQCAVYDRPVTGMMCWGNVLFQM